jgi:hypothetical protein
MAEPIDTSIRTYLPKVLNNRWTSLKSKLHNIISAYNKEELILELLSKRENHTTIPTLSEITLFSGYDVAINTIHHWNWKSKNSLQSEGDFDLIGKIGAEIITIHSIGECIKNNLLSNKNSIIEETEMGILHFNAVNSFNIDVTGTRMDIVRRKFQESRMNKSHKGKDTINNIISVRNLYLENSVLMLLRAPLPFYTAMKSLTPKQHEQILDFHIKLTQKSENTRSGIKKIRIKKSSELAKILNKLTLSAETKDKSPRFVACIRKDFDEEKYEYSITLGALAMFSMFLLGFKTEQLHDKAFRAENAVRDVIEYNGFFEIIETNKQITSENGEALTEIDILAKSKQKIDGEYEWVHIEVKDFSYWRGWIFGKNIAIREEYYKTAVNKLELKEQYIKDKHQCKRLTSIIVTSIPEVFTEVDNVKLTYLSDLHNELLALTKKQPYYHKPHSSSNYFIHYYERLRTDLKRAKSINTEIIVIRTEINELKKSLKSIKSDFKEKQDILKINMSAVDTLKVSMKLTKKRLIKDTGEKHFKIENELKSIESELSIKERELNRTYHMLKDIKEIYEATKLKIDNHNKTLEDLTKQYNRLIIPRSI